MRDIAETERVLIGCAILHPEVIRYAGTVDPFQISTPQWRAAWAAIMALNAEGRKITAWDVADRAERDGSAPGMLALITAATSDVVTGDNIDHYARAVRDDWERRELDAALEQAKTLNRQGADRAEVIAALETKASAKVDAFRTVSQRLKEEAPHRRRLAAKVSKFNIQYLDDCCGGIYPTDLILLCAASGAGKTTIAALVAQMASAQGRRVHFFALEAHKAEIEQRIKFREICGVLRAAGKMHGGITYRAWLYGELSDAITPAVELSAEQALGTSMDNLRTFYRDHEFTASDITRLFRAVQDDTDLIILDHLHYIDADDSDGENRGLKEITRAIRNAALAIEKPVIVVAHLRKRDRNKPRLIPDIDDVHGSSDIVKIATKVIMLAPSREMCEPGIARTYMQVVKDRFAGVQGIAAECRYDLRELNYGKQYTLGRLAAGGDRFDALPSNERPKWASMYARVST